MSGGRAEAAGASILHRLCAHGLDAEPLVGVLQSLLSGHTALLVHGTIVDQCSEEVQSLLCFCHTREANRLLASAPAPAALAPRRGLLPLAL